MSAKKKPDNIWTRRINVNNAVTLERAYIMKSVLLEETQKTNIDQNVIENGSNQDTMMPRLIRDSMCHTQKVADTMEM